MWGGVKACCQNLPSASLELVGSALIYRQGLKQITFSSNEKEITYLKQVSET